MKLKTRVADLADPKFNLVESNPTV